jgi:hypothetical protein
MKQHSDHIMAKRRRAVNGRNCRHPNRRAIPPAVQAILDAIGQLSPREREYFWHETEKLSESVLGRYVVMPERVLDELLDCIQGAMRMLERAMTLAGEQGNLAWRYRAKPRNRERDERWARLYAQGQSYGQIALNEGAKLSAVKAAVRRFNRRK